MRIAIATSGRFHVLELARELIFLGHETVLWSVLPVWRTRRFSLPDQAHHGLLPVMFPLVAVHRWGNRKMRRRVDPILTSALDRAITRRLTHCDVFIGMSGVAVASAKAARERFRAKIIIERGSRHILSQRKILDEIARNSPQAETVAGWAVQRELASYEQADLISIPSRHVLDSFSENGVAESRLFVNPYGVDLQMFQPTAAPIRVPRTVIYTGAWSLQKGCDILSAAIARFDGSVKLLHVGPVGDAPLPTESWFWHQDQVPQWRLPKYYAQGHVFAQASLQEGLSLVIAQALACGLPVVCTDRTGGEDLVSLVDLKEGVFVVPHGNVDALTDGLRRALEWADHRFPIGQPRDMLGTQRDKLSWKAYGKRYHDRLMQLVTGENYCG